MTLFVADLPESSACVFLYGDNDCWLMPYEKKCKADILYDKPKWCPLVEIYLVPDLSTKYSEYFTKSYREVNKNR
jgi:hypothetical protein